MRGLHSIASRCCCKVGAPSAPTRRACTRHWPRLTSIPTGLPVFRSDPLMPPSSLAIRLKRASTCCGRSGRPSRGPPAKFTTASLLSSNRLPAEFKESDEAKFLSAVAHHHVYNIVHLIYRPKGYESEPKDY